VAAFYDKPLPRWLTEPGVLWVLFFASFVPRLVFVTVVHPPGDHITSDMGVYDLRAMHLMSGELGPWDSFTPAGYPAFLAMLGREFALIGIVQAALSALTVVLTYKLAMEICRHQKVALLAAIAIALHLPMVLYSGLILSETLFSFLLVLASYLLVRSASKPSLWWAACAGVALGLAAVVRPNLLLVFPFVPVFFFFGLGRAVGKVVGYSVVVLAIVLVPVAVHSWHNTRLVDRWVPTSTNGGLNFYLNFAEIKSIKFKEGSYTHHITPVPNVIRYDEDEHVDRPFYDDRYFYSAALRLIADEPTRLLKWFWSLKEALGLGRQDYWPSWPPWRIWLGVESRAFTFLFVLPGLFGLVLLFRRRVPFREAGAGWLWITALIVGNLVAAGVYLGDPRLRVPYDPFFAIAAGVAYLELVQRLRGWRTVA
jgi:4-amino-4-deoxy-L-arabinose transferase-like glycosyltransferase